MHQHQDMVVSMQAPQRHTQGPCNPLATLQPCNPATLHPPRTAQASSVKNNDDEYHPDNVTTEDRDETWHAGKTAPAHIDLDLGASAMIEHLDLLPYQARLPVYLFAQWDCLC